MPYYLALAASFVAFLSLLAVGARGAITLPIGIIFFALLFSWRRRAVEYPSFLREIPVVSVVFRRLSKAQVIAGTLLLATVLSGAVVVFQTTRRPPIVVVYSLAVLAIILAIWLFRLVRVMRTEGWRGDKRIEK